MGESVLLFFTNLSQNLWWVRVGLCRYLMLLIWPSQTPGYARLQTHAVIEMLFVVNFRISVLHKKAFIFVRHSSRKSVSVLIGTSLKFRASIDISARDLSTDPPLPTEERPIKKCNGSSTWLVFCVRLTSRSSACSVCYFFFFFSLGMGALQHSTCLSGQSTRTPKL